MPSARPLPPLPYPIELTPPDLAPYRGGNTGIDYVNRFDSGRPGPHVLVTALVHGNELCGAIALDWLLRERFRPARGVLTLAFCNVLAFEHFDPAAPGESRYMDEDFNRVWSHERLDRAHGSGADSTELRRARELRPVVDAADLLLDIHSMQHKTPALIISGPHEKERLWSLRRKVGEAVRAHSVKKEEDTVVPRAELPGLLRFVKELGRKYGFQSVCFGHAGDAKNSLLVECGQHWETASVDVAKECLVRFLAYAGVADPVWAAHHLPPKAPAPQRVIEVTHAVTIKSQSFRFAEEFRGLEVIANRGAVLAHDGDEPVTTPYDNCVLIMPSRRLMPGQTAVRLGRYLD